MLNLKDVRKNKEEFNYVIARKWDEDSNHLSCYSYGQTVFYGTIDDAEEMLEFVKNKSEQENDYKIFKINNNPL